MLNSTITSPAATSGRESVSEYSSARTCSERPSGSAGGGPDGLRLAGPGRCRRPAAIREPTPRAERRSASEGTGGAWPRMTAWPSSAPMTPEPRGRRPPARRRRRASATTASAASPTPHQATRLYFWNEAAFGMIGSALTLNQSSISVR